MKANPDLRPLTVCERQLLAQAWTVSRTSKTMGTTHMRDTQTKIQRKGAAPIKKPKASNVHGSLSSYALVLTRKSSLLLNFTLLSILASHKGTTASSKQGSRPSSPRVRIQQGRSHTHSPVQCSFIHPVAHGSREPVRLPAPLRASKKSSPPPPCPSPQAPPCGRAYTRPPPRFHTNGSAPNSL